MPSQVIGNEAAAASSGATRRLRSIHLDLQDAPKGPQCQRRWRRAMQSLIASSADTVNRFFLATLDAGLVHNTTKRDEDAVSLTLVLLPRCRQCVGAQAALAPAKCCSSCAWTWQSAPWTACSSG